MERQIIGGRSVYWTEEYGTRYLVVTHGRRWIPLWGPVRAELEALAYALLRVEKLPEMLRCAKKHGVRLARSRWGSSVLPKKSGEVSVPKTYSAPSSSGVKAKVTGKQLINGRL